MLVGIFKGQTTSNFHGLCVNYGGNGGRKSVNYGGNWAKSVKYGGRSNICKVQR